MDSKPRTKFFRPISRRLNSLSSNALLRGAEAFLRPESSSSIMNGEILDSVYDDDNLAPVMPAIDAVQQLMEEERRSVLARELDSSKTLQDTPPVNSDRSKANKSFGVTEEPLATTSNHYSSPVVNSSNSGVSKKDVSQEISVVRRTEVSDESRTQSVQPFGGLDLADNQIRDNDSLRISPPTVFFNLEQVSKNEEYEFVPKSVILDIYSNDPEVKRFLRQLPRIGNEFGYNEQDYKCYSCRRPIGMVFGQSRLCHYDGHHYCSECHLGEKATIPARILCNWDFNKYPISKRNQNFLTLISNEPMFELKTIAPLLFKTCLELKEIEELRCQAFFVRSYCFTCVQDSISFELTKLVWPREHLIKQTDTYSIEDLIQIKNGSLKHTLKNIITFGRRHVLSCMLCCQKGFICEICKSSQIIYPFDTESVHRCNNCKSIYHKVCFKSRTGGESCPRCQRLKARRDET